MICESCGHDAAELTQLYEIANAALAIYNASKDNRSLSERAMLSDAIDNLVVDWAIANGHEVAS